jgi:hypothetical protein
MPEYKIPDLVSMFESGEIAIPEFQREFVWSNNQVRDLAESIYREYPIGVLTFYKVPQSLRRSIESNVRFWVLDGQQRLLSLVIIMKGKVEAYRGGRKETIMIDLWFDPINESFELKAPRTDEEKRKWIKLSELLQITRRDSLEKLLLERGYSPEEKERISTLWSRFRKDYSVLVYELPETLNLDDLANIFIRTNFAGTRVRGLDVYSTMIAVTSLGLIKDMRNFATSLPIDIDYGILIRTLVAFITDGKVKLASRVFDQAEKLKEVIEDKKDVLKDMADNVKKCVQYVVEMLQRFGVIELPTENVIPVMAYYVYKRRALMPEEEEGIFKWFVLASFFGRYSSSAETRLDEDLNTIKNGGSYIDLIKNIEQREGNLKLRLMEYIDAGEYDKSTKLLLYALLRMTSARDFKTLDPLTLANSVVHHIFPRKFVRDEKLANDIGNLTLLTHSTNMKLSSMLPENYLATIPPEVLKEHYIPLEKDLWKLDNIEKFLQRRKENLKKAIEKFLEAVM